MFMRMAIEEAYKAEAQGNLPIGAVVAQGQRLITSAQNSVMTPDFHPGEHAEINALRRIPTSELPNASSFTLYVTLELCVMCLGAVVLHRVGRVVFGASDPNRGAGYLIPSISERYPEKYLPELIGPTHSTECDPLFERANRIYRTIRKAD
jgi:tRNA(adenine34) deaminase